MTREDAQGSIEQIEPTNLGRSSTYAGNGSSQRELGAVVTEWLQSRVGGNGPSVGADSPQHRSRYSGARGRESTRPGSLLRHPQRDGRESKPSTRSKQGTNKRGLWDRCNIVGSFRGKISDSNEAGTRWKATVTLLLSIHSVSPRRRGRRWTG